MIEIEKGLDELAKQELAKALLTHGMMHSNHHAYAVLKEELEEMFEAAAEVSQDFDHVWDSVKEDDLIVEELREMRESLLHMGAELVQALAMIAKWKLLFEDPRVQD
jgi:hypothetical protein